ncbi:24347_t:CDS:10, partial [Gigaspora margarita]
MDPASATLLSILHKSQASPSESTMAGQKSPPPLPAPEVMSPNPLTSLFSTINQNSLTSPVSTTPHGVVVSQIQSPSNGEFKNLPSSTAVDPTLNVDKASTESLKLALFGRSTPLEERAINKAIYRSQQENEIQYQPETLIVSNENPEDEDNSFLEETSEIDEQLSSPTEVIDYNKLSSLESIKPTSTSTAIKHSPPVTNKSIFTYSNPFDLLKKSPPSSPSHRHPVVHQWTSQSSPPSQKKKDVSTVQKEGGVFYRSQQQIEPFLSGFSAWNVRANSAPKGQTSIPDGVKLPRGILLYDTGERNEKVLCSKDLELTTITLIPSDLEYRLGKSIAVNGRYICYVVKGGKIRVISTLYGSKTLLKNHDKDKSILDMCIRETSHDGLDQGQSEKQLLLTIGGDSKITVWEISEPPSEPSAEIPYAILSYFVIYERNIVLLEIDARESLEDSKQPRYHRAVWHPLNPNLFAVAADTNEVMVFDIIKILEGNETGSFKESEISEKILKSQIHHKPISDLAFSYDGTILATASEDCVIFSALNQEPESDMSISPVRKIILDGQQVSSVLFVDKGEFSSEQSSFKFRYVVIGTERNTMLHLYDVESDEYIQSIKFLPPPERRSSLNKGYRKEEAMFNCISFDQRSHTLVIANSARISIFALHLNMPSKNLEKLDLFNQSNLMGNGQFEYDSITTPDEFSILNSVQFDYMIEFPVNQLIGSFVIIPDTTSSNGFSLYCIQSKAVQQYCISGDLLLPPNIDACPEYVSAERVLDRQRQDDEDDAKKEQGAIYSESLDFSSNTEGVNVEESTAEKDIIKETLVVENSYLAGDGPEITSATSEVDESTSTGKQNMIIEGNMSESTYLPDESEAKNVENQKTTNIKLSTAVNGAIAKLKEKKKTIAATSTASVVQNAEISSDSEKTSRRKESRRGLEKEKDNENFIQSSEVTNKSAGKKSAEGVPKNGKSNAGGEKNRKATEILQDGTNIKVSGGKSYSGPEVPPTIGQSSTTASGTGISPAQMQTILKEIKKMEDNIEDERIAHQAAETSRQEAILKIVSQTLSTNTTKLLESTIRNEVQTSVLPTLSKMVTTAVDKHAHKGMVDAVNKNIPAAIEKSVADNVQRVLAKTPVIESIAKGVSKSIRPVIEETFRENFTTVLIPSYQKATNAMFEQITATFEAGLQDIAHKSAQVSYSNMGSVGDQNALARLQASLEHLTLSIQQLQQLHLQVNPQSNLTRHVEQQVNRTSDELQHHLARSLSGELKRILIPHNCATTQPPPTAGLEDSNNSVIERALEAQNYEDAFVAVLASHELPLILRLCSNVSPKTVFPPARPLLSQPVILSLIHHLSLELNKYSELKLAWMEEAVIKLNPKDLIIREHCERLLPMVKQRLEQYYYQVASQDPQSPNLKNISLLVHVVN